MSDQKSANKPKDNRQNNTVSVRIVRRKNSQCRESDDAPIHTSALVHRVLAARGVTSAAELEFSFDDLPRPDTLPNIDEAVDRLVLALQNQQRVLVVGDYDCDGATSTSLAVLGLRDFGFKHVDFIVPNRFEFGYGLSPAIVEVAAKQKPDLIVTVDNGVASFEGVKKANAINIDVLVTDHHLPPDKLPEAVAIVNPSLVASTFPSKNLAGVGVVFYVLLALRSKLKAMNLPGGQARLSDYLDLVAVGTVADVVPLDRVNRTLVEQGLRRIRQGRTRAGISAILSRAGRDQHRAIADDIGFAIGPRLNAAGRIDDMTRGIDCLLTDDELAAHKMAIELDTFNQKRKTIEKTMRDEAEAALAQAALKANHANDSFTVVLFDEQWHQGVIGILAGQLKESLHKPTVVFTADGHDLIRGSARSIEGVHIRDVFDTLAAQNPGMIDKFGGHAMAAGLSIARDQFSRFAEVFDAEVKRVCNGVLPARQWLSDGSMSDTDRTLETAQLLQTVGPWGQGFPAPIFDDRFLVESARVVGLKHLKLELRSLNTDPAVPQGKQYDAIAFKQPACLAAGDEIRLVYSLSENHFRGETRLQLMVKHIQSATG